MQQSVSEGQSPGEGRGWVAWAPASPARARGPQRGVVRRLHHSVWQPIKGQPLRESRAASTTEQGLIWVWTHVVWQTCLWKTEGFLVDFYFLCEYWDEVLSLE